MRRFLSVAGISTGIYYYYSSKSVESFFFGKKEEKIDENLYVWGNGYYQTRPDMKNQFNNFYPKKIVGNFDGKRVYEKVPKFKEVKFTSKNGFGIDF